LFEKIKVAQQSGYDCGACLSSKSLFKKVAAIVALHQQRFFTLNIELCSKGLGIELALKTLYN
jgi:hypothetical protein